MCYEHLGYGALGQVLKVDAHKGKDQATLEGWGEHWQGNDAADQVAKLVRPKQTGSEKRQGCGCGPKGHEAAGGSHMQQARGNVEVYVQIQEDVHEACWQAKAGGHPACNDIP